MTIEYNIYAPLRSRANIQRRARDGAHLDRILRDYYGIGGLVSQLKIEPVVVLGTVGEPQELPGAGAKGGGAA